MIVWILQGTHNSYRVCEILSCISLQGRLNNSGRPDQSWEPQILNNPCSIICNLRHMFCPITLLSIRFPLCFGCHTMAAGVLLQSLTDLHLVHYVRIIMCHIVKILEDCMNITEDYHITNNPVLLKRFLMIHWSKHLEWRFTMLYQFVCSDWNILITKLAI